MSAWVCRSVTSALLVLAADAAPAGPASAAASAEGAAAPLPTPQLGVVLAAPPDTLGGRLIADSTARGLPIRSIHVVARTIYDPVPAGRLGPVYRIANRLHVVTRASTVREHVVVTPGERWDDDHGRETLRELRKLEFLQPVALRARPSNDSVDVEVETRDIWSTLTEFNLEHGGGQNAGTIGVSERNVLGYGKSLSFSYHTDPTGISRLASWNDPAMGGSHARMQLVAGSGSAGITDGISVGVPFWSEDAPYTATASWSRTKSTGRLFDQGSVAAEFDQRHDDIELDWGRGGRVDGLVRRTVFSFRTLDRRFGPSRLQPGAPDEFAGESEDLRIHRLSAELRLWKPRFVERHTVDFTSGIEDFDVGTQAAVELGFAPRLLGSTTDESFLRFELDGGADTPLGFGWVRSSMETRFRWQARELVRTIDARWVNQSLPRQTLVGAAYGIWGQHVERDFQPIVGGLSGLRAYPVHALAGRQLWRFNLEDRCLLARDWSELADIGAAWYWDGARAWGAGAEGTGWYHDAGIGLRLGFPRLSSGQLVRLDLAWPIQPDRNGRHDAVFSFGSYQAF